VLLGQNLEVVLLTFVQLTLYDNTSYSIRMQSFFLNTIPLKRRKFSAKNEQNVLDLDLIITHTESSKQISR